MDVSNSLISTGVKLPFQAPKSQEQSRALVLPVTAENPKNASRNEQSFNINSAELVRKAEAVQNTRIQRDNTLESAPFKGQQAVNAYQQTIESARQFEEGELVGIDLYV